MGFQKGQGGPQPPAYQLAIAIYKLHMCDARLQLQSTRKAFIAGAGGSKRGAQIEINHAAPQR
jgi:hypothetical protein